MTEAQRIKAIRFALRERDMSNLTVGRLCRRTARLRITASPQWATEPKPVKQPKPIKPVPPKVEKVEPVRVRKTHFSWSPYEEVL